MLVREREREKAVKEPTRCCCPVLSALTPAASAICVERTAITLRRAHSNHIAKTAPAIAGLGIVVLEFKVSTSP
eukprot:3299276-Amphidinium_carterae.1